MKLKSFIYKGFEFDVLVFEDGRFYCSNSFLSGDTTKDIDKAIESSKIELDIFLSTMPTNYTELAALIEGDVIVWDGYEECHIDIKALEIVVDNFIKASVKND